MRLSTIIPAYSRHELTARHAEECLKSKRVPDEVIVVNDGGAPNLREMLPKGVIYANITEDILWNYNGAVNLGVWLASSEVIAIEDTDHIPNRELYWQAMEVFKARPTIEKIQVSRSVVEQIELAKPMEEWVVSRFWGPNVMVSFMKKSVYARMKGQDERFARKYGYMAYDWKWRMAHFNVETTKIHGYYAIVGDGGEPGLKRGMNRENLSLLHENAHREDHQFQGGILNFNFTVEKL